MSQLGVCVISLCFYIKTAKSVHFLSTSVESPSVKDSRMGQFSIISQILKECDVRQECNLFNAVNDTKYVHMSSLMIKVPLFVYPA